MGPEPASVETIEPAPEPQKRPSRRPIRRALRPLRHRALVAGFRFADWLCRRLSHRQCLAIGRLIGRIGHAFARGERAKAMRHLELAYGDALSEIERSRIVREVFQTIGMNALEAFNSAAWSDDDFRARVEFIGGEHAEAALAPGKGSIYMTGHFGNWELMPMSYLAHSGLSVGAIMQRTRVPELDALIRKLRGGPGTTIFMADDPGIRFVRMLKKGGVLSMLADQDSKKVNSTHVTFFGRPARTPTGGPFLARKTGASILPLFIHRRSDDPTRHVFRFHPPIFPDASLSEEEDVRRMLQIYTSALEQEVREHPGQWMWLHERWRHQPK